MFSPIIRPYTPAAALIEASVPEWFENIVNRLHAKSPDDRPTSASEVAEMLQGCLAHVQQPTTTPLPVPVAKLARSFDHRGKSESAESHGDFHYKWPPISKYVAAAAFALSLIFAGVLIVLEWNKGTLTIESEVDDVPIRIMQGMEVVEKLTLTRSGEKVRIAAGNYVVEIDGQSDGITVKDGTVSLQRRGTEIVRIVYSGDHANDSATVKAEAADSESDSEFAQRRFGDKITVDLYGGSDVLSQMNTQGANKEKHTRLFQELNAIEGVVTNFREAGPGNIISMAMVRDPSSQCSRESQSTGKPSELRNEIDAALQSAGITSVRWEEGDISQKSAETEGVPGAEDASAVAITPTGHRAWQQTDLYLAPKFSEFFSDSREGGLALDALWNAADKDSRSDEEILKTVRDGFRKTREHRMPILRWIGNKYIWNKSPQNPDAIEIMYHAADFTGENANPSGARHDAVYFGLSVTQPKTPAILRTLAELAMHVDDPNDLDRIAWGCSNQKSELLEYLKPFHESDDETVRNKADVCRRIFSGELKAFAWAAEQAHQRAEKNYSSQLPKFKETLMSGSSEERLKALNTILQDRIALIMDDSFVAAFKNCAEDKDPQVRVQTTIIAGAKWVWEAQEQNAEAIQLMLKLSKDEHRDVRYNAVYYGLSTVRMKSDDVIRRLLELAFEDREWNLFHRIEWGLRDDRERVATMLTDYISGEDETKSEAAREVFEQLTGREAPPLETAMVANDAAHTISGFVMEFRSGTPDVPVCLCDAVTGYPVAKDTYRQIDWSNRRGGSPAKEMAIVVSDEKGNFRFEKVPDGTYRLIAQKWIGPYKGVFELHGAEIRLLGAVDEITVPRPADAQEARVVPTPLGENTIQFNQNVGNNETFLFLSTAPPEFCPILGPQCLGTAFWKNLIGVNRMPLGKTTAIGTPDKPVYAFLFAADNSPGFATITIPPPESGLARVPAEPFVASWSNGRKTPPEKLAELIEFMKKHDLTTQQLLDIPELSNANFKARQKRMQELSSDLSRKIELPEGQTARIGDLLAADAYRRMQKKK